MGANEYEYSSDLANGEDFFSFFLGTNKIIACSVVFLVSEED